jgi:hypothetical protein
VQGTQLQPFNAINSNAKDKDNYPLPPSEGPTLRQTPIAPEQLPVGLVPLGSSSLAMIPTFSTAAQGTALGAVPLGNAANSSPAPRSSVGGQDAIGQQNSFLGFNPIMDAYALPGIGEQRTQVNNQLANLERNTSTPPGAIQDGPFDQTKPEVVNVAESGNRFSADIETAVLGNPHNAPRNTMRQVDAEKALNTTSTPHFLLVLVLAGFGIHYVRVKPRLPGEAAITMMKSVWSRFTKRLGRSGVGKSTQGKDRELGSTRVAQIVPDECRHAAPPTGSAV